VCPGSSLLALSSVTPRRMSGYTPSNPIPSGSPNGAAGAAGASATVAAPGLRLRPWQVKALEALEKHPHPDFLAVATPGAGKTTFALTAVRRSLIARRSRRVVVVVPTQHLKQQWAHAAERLDIHLDPEWSAGYGALPSDVHGIAVTYQQVAANPRALRGLVADAVVVLDEIHHAADSRSWGDGVRLAFEPAKRRLCLSGTPFRSDQSTIPFIRYEGDEAQSDYEYGYADALKDPNVVRPVYFPRINGRMEWHAPAGITYSATFDDKLTRELANQRLRTALDLEGEWLPGVLRQAHAQLMHVRREDPRAGGLVIAMDQEHARGIAQVIEQGSGRAPVVATSDEPDASAKISQFSAASSAWIVAVRMVSEGVDIPRLRVGVFATNTLTDLFFRQAVGRLVRWSGPLARQQAYMFIPNDPRLRAYAAAVAEQRRHCLQKRSLEDDAERSIDDLRDDREPETEEPDLEQQLNLFSALSAVPLDEHGQPLEEDRVIEPEDDPEGAIPGMVEPPPHTDEAGPWVALMNAPVPAPEPGPLPEPFAASISTPGVPGPDKSKPQSPLQRRRALREENSRIVRDIVFHTQRGHADVNAELNRKVGIRRISEASIKQLERRLRFARSWLARL